MAVCRDFLEVEDFWEMSLWVAASSSEPRASHKLLLFLLLLEGQGL